MSFSHVAASPSPSPSPIPLSVAGVTAGPDVASGQSGFVKRMALSAPSLLLLLSASSVVCSCTPVLISIVMLI